MMLTIHGFPVNTKYQDVKLLIKGECNISDFILDNLLSDGEGTKKVRVGLTDNAEGYKLMKCLNGYRMSGNHVLKVVPVGKTAPAPPQQNTFDPRSGYSNPQRNEFPNQPRNDYMNMNQSNDYGNKGVHGHSGSHGHPGSHGQGAPPAPGSSRYGGQVYGSTPSYGQGPSAPRGPQGQPNFQDNMGRPSPWVSGSSTTNQWNDNQPMSAQIPQNTFSYNSQPQNLNSSYVPQQHLQNQGPPVPEVRSFNQDRAAPVQSGFPPKNNTAPVPQPARPSDSRRALRNIETVEISGGHAPDHSRYPVNQPFPQDKPLTIKKDNFQGPTTYNINNPGHTGLHPDVGRSSPYQGQTNPAPWQSQAQQPKQQFPKSSPIGYENQYDDRKYIDSDNRDPKIQPARVDQDRNYKDYDKRHGFPVRRSPHRRRGSAERRMSPSGRRVSPARRVSPTRVSPSRRASPPGKRISPPGRRVSPPGRRVSPPGRRVSPPGRRVSPPGRRVSPPGRRLVSPGRRVTPPGRRLASPRRRASAERRVPGNHPAARRPSPHKRMSPNRRLVSPRASPNRRVSPHRQPARYSPDHSAKYGQDKLKHVRPAYEPTTHAPNQAKYSGGFRPNVHESVQYPVQGGRQVEQRNSPWQREPEDVSGPMKTQDDDRRDVTRMPLGRRPMPDIPVDTPRNHSPQRKSRSPLRHDRSSYRDNYKRISPSTCRSSHSPSRSWALEKRRSPEIRDAPPPPSWPDQNLRDNDYSRPTRPNFPERDQNIKDKHIPVWERPIEKEVDPRGRRMEHHEQRTFNDEKNRAAKVLAERDLLPHPSHIDKHPQRDAKFAPREYPNPERRDNYRRRDESPDRKLHPHREEYESTRRPREHDERHQPHPDELRRRREPSPRHDIRKDDIANPNIEKDFEDIYKRALLFKKKTEELRRLGSKKRDEFLEEDVNRSHHSEREREDINRSQRYEDRHRYPEEEAMRMRDERRDVRRLEPRVDERRLDTRLDERREFRPNDDYQHTERDRAPRYTASPSIRAKREKAVEEITNKIIDRHENYRNMKGEQRNRVQEELSLTIGRIVHEMFGDSDVSFIEIIIKYQAKYSDKEEQKILQDIMASLPSQFRTIKRKAPESTEVLAKTARRSPSPQLKQEPAPRPKLSDSRWTLNIMPPEVVTLPILDVPPGIPQALPAMPAMPPVMNPAMVPMMVPAPFAHPYEGMPSMPPPHMYAPEPMPYPQTYPEQPSDECYKLYLCKDDFNQITELQANLLKNFIITKMFNETTQSQGWAPDFTLKGLQSQHRYELLTKDDSSRDWLVNLDFSEFKNFNVLVYTKEELWYERAAIWLPGHSKVRPYRTAFEPLTKLKLQNRRVEGMNIDKWKFVKKIVTRMGTRLYVDMPPSSARALEKQKMLLSYDLQKVSVFLKAVAVDKDAFDAGLKEPSVEDPNEIATAAQNTPIPSLTYDPTMVKITLGGCKTLPVTLARKLKEAITNHLFRYLKSDGNSRTDFLKYGFYPPNYFGIVPENEESKRWLLSQNFGKINRLSIIVIGGDEKKIPYYRMSVTLPNTTQIKTDATQANLLLVTERLKQSNQGVKGIHFNLWKPIRILSDRKNSTYEVDIDIDSLETLSKMKYQLDYVDYIDSHTLYFESEYSESKLEEIISRHKSETTDSYDVANMDLDTDSDEEIICLDD